MFHVEHGPIQQVIVIRTNHRRKSCDEVFLKDRVYIYTSSTWLTVAETALYEALWPSSSAGKSHCHTAALRDSMVRGGVDG